METAKNPSSKTADLSNINDLVGNSAQQKSVLKSFLMSDWSKMIFTFILLLSLFAITFFLSFLSSQRRLYEAKDVVPEAEIKLPQEIPTPQQQGISTENPVVLGECVISGCNSEICQGKETEPLNTVCVYKQEYSCYQNAVCEKQADGACGWTQTGELTSCLAQYQFNE